MQTLIRLLVLLCLCNTSTLSATTNPAKSVETFLQNLETHISASQNEAVITAYKQFKTTFSGATYKEDEKTLMVKVLDNMLERKMTASPYFELYFKSLNALGQKEIETKPIADWHQSLEGILEGITSRRFKPLQTYLDFSVQFFEKDILRYSKTGVSWVAESEDFQLVFEEGEPRVKFTEMNLSANRKERAIQIEATAGFFAPLQAKWNGKGGKVSWKRHQIEDVFCTLSDYQIDAKKGSIKATKTHLHHKAYFGAQTLEGSFEDKLVMDNGDSYPKFDSYDKDIVLDKITEGLHYEGGIAIYGTKVYGKGDKENYAIVELYNNQNQRILKGIGETFVINDKERISGENIRTTIYFDQDSIYHPATNVKYTFNNRELNLFRGDKGQERTPFYSSFHQMALDADNVDWVVTADSILIGRKVGGFAGSNKRVAFQSLGYFDESEYLRLQNGADRHPLATLHRLCYEMNTKVIPAQAYATSLKQGFNLDNILSMLIDLAKKDFITYDKKTETLTVKDKVEHYVKAYHKKNDYDNMKMTSESKETHAVIHIGQKNMLANGIKQLEISQTQKVAIKPTGGQLEMGEDRDMRFDGKIFAGHSSLLGKGYFFDYTSNTIKADSVRYFDLFLPEQEGDEGAVSIASRIEHAQGLLMIDAPNNKSGREDIEGFPSFKSEAASYIYYDKKDTQKGIYKRDAFFFKLNPFHLNDLDALQTSDLSFDGSFVSFGIFPDFEETAVIRSEDQSLGFATTTPANGYSLYGKGNYTGGIDLSNKGLLGSGELEYLWAKINTNDIIFRPKQMTGSAHEFVLTENRTDEVPEVFAKDVNINWIPYKDSMYIDTKKEAFSLFKAKEHDLEGTLVLTPDGLKGKGIFNWEQGILKSKLFSFGANSIQSDTTNVSIKAFKTQALAFDTKNVNADIDFDEKRGVFKANSEESHTLMPYNNYQTNLGDFIWDMKAETITFTGEKLGRFTSIHPDQDSLDFQGATALYDMKTSYLKIGGITHINAADALIYPNEGKATIKPGGLMETLRGAKIVANVANKNHVIKRATVTIKGKKEYTASGFYEYNIGDKKQEIAFKDIVGMPVGKGKRSEKKLVTRGTGEVEEAADFYMDEKIKFKGTIHLDAESKNLAFDGFAGLDSPYLPEGNWFSIQNQAAKENLIVPYHEAKSPEGELLETGLYLSKTFISIYPRVMTPLHTRKDRAILPISGVFKYDKAQDAFLFGDSLRISQGTNFGNILSLSNKDGMVKGEGLFSVGPMLEGIKVKASGRVNMPIVRDTSSTAQTKFDFLAGIDMPIPKKLLAVMQADLAASAYDAQPIPYAQPEKYTNIIASFVSKAEDRQEAIETMLSYRDLKLPKADNQFDFLFSELAMKWDEDYQSLVSTTDKLGLVAVNGQNFSQRLEAYLEFKMPSTDDNRLHVYLKSQSGYFYFFSYKQGVLSMASDNLKFSQAFLGLKKKELSVKVNSDESYELQQVDASSAQRFVRRIQAVNSAE